MMIDGSPTAVQAASHDEAQERAQRGTRQLLVARVCVLASGYLATVILTRGLGPAAYGIYGVVLSQLVWLEMSANAGVVGAITKVMADGRHDDGEIERSGRALLLGLSILLLVICWMMAPHVAKLMQIPNGEVLFRIAIIELPFAAVFASYNGILLGRREFGFLAVAHVVHGTTRLAGVVALIGLGFTVERVLILSVLSTGVVCLVLAFRYHPHGFRPTGWIMREIAVLTAPMALYLVAAQVLLNLDLWSLKSLWEGEGQVVGQYVAAINLAKLLMIIPVAQAGVLFASVAVAVASHNTARARRHIQDATRFAVIVAAAAGVILGLNASDVLFILYSGAYADGGVFLPFQLAGVGLFALLDAFARSLIAAGRHWFVAGTLVAIVPLTWFSNYVLIPWLGPLGAATSMLLGLTISAVLTGTMAYRYFGPVIRLSTVIRVLIAAGVVALVSIEVQAHGALIMVKLGLLGGLYLLGLYVLGEITSKDFGFRGAVRPSTRPERLAD